MNPVQKLKAKFNPKLSSPAFLWGLILLAALLALLVLNGILPADAGEVLPWSTPMAPQSTPTAAPPPGWWEQMPTPQPLSPTGAAQ